MNTNIEGLEITSNFEEGYHPIVRSGDWRVAVINSSEQFLEENVVAAERHFKTDEVFMLLKGSARLYIGENKECVCLEPFKAYNVKLNVWHSIALDDDTTVLIVEGDDTSKEMQKYDNFNK